MKTAKNTIRVKIILSSIHFLVEIPQNNAFSAGENKTAVVEGQK